jgi:hypothetical protein
MCLTIQLNAAGWCWTLLGISLFLQFNPNPNPGYTSQRSIVQHARLRRSICNQGLSLITGHLIDICFMIVHRFNDRSRLGRRNRIDVLFVELSRSRLVTGRRNLVVLGNLYDLMYVRARKSDQVTLHYARYEMPALDGRVCFGFHSFQSFYLPTCRFQATNREGSTWDATQGPKV